ncbi:hypothetical protein CSUI_010715 [Cystoisospora suis]|uniref:Uncharacterized protein n=1 Tax=Cystoisospora suis TaxID=483139 RepID=A0A2C6KG06_9APIC|nr:hypothetical protein CSUI_010715 [Cystoisospora suis]
MTGFRGGCRGSWSSLALRKPSASKHGSCRSRAIFVAPPVHHLSHSPSDWADDDFWSFVDRRTYRFALGVTARQGVYGRVRNTAFTVATPPAQALQVFLLPCLRFFSASAVDPGKRIGFLSDSNRGRVTPEMLELVGISVEPKRRRENSLSFPPPLMSDENAVSQGTGANAGEASTLHGKFSQVLPEPTATPLKLQVSEPVFQISPSHLSGPILIDRSSFCSLEEMGTGDRPGAPADFSGYIRSLLFSARTPRVTRDEAVESLGRRSVAHHPITFKRYKEGMTAAHYYPSRLLHPSKAAPLPKGVYVTPFTSVEKASSMGSISSKVLHRRAGKPLAATTDHEGHLHTPQTPVPLDERVMGRLTLLFIFTTHPPHSEVKDLSRWRQALEEQPDYISLVYQNSTADLQARQSCEHGALMQCLSVPDFPQHPPLRRKIRYT